MLRKLLAAAILGSALALGACATNPDKGPTYPVVGTVDQTKLEQSAFAARSTYAALARIAAEYVAQPRCGTARAPASPLCSSQAAVNEIRRHELAADTATRGAEDLARNPTRTSVALANAVSDATRAVETFRATVAVYKPAALQAK